MIYGGEETVLTLRPRLITGNKLGLPPHFLQQATLIITISPQRHLAEGDGYNLWPSSLDLGLLPTHS